MSILADLAELPGAAIDEILAELGPIYAQAVYVRAKHDWNEWARPEQLPPPGDDWRFWVCIAGRGGGKTRTGAEWVIDGARTYPGIHTGLLAATAADARDTMVKAILEASPPWFEPRYYPTNRRIIWPNGSVATTYSADEPDQTRGANLHRGWCDELGKFRDQAEGQVTAWENFVLAVRLRMIGMMIVSPQLLVTTTPRRVGRGAELVKDLSLGKKVGGKRAVVVPEGDPAVWRPRPNVVVHRWSTDRNRQHLAASFLTDLDDQYEGTSLEAQERRGEILDETEGALWSEDVLNRNRVKTVPPLARVLVSVDPSFSDRGTGDEAGIIVGGLGVDGDVYVMADRSQRGSPLAWAKAAIAAYNEFRADGLVYESNTVKTEKTANIVTDTIKAADPEARVNWIPVHASRDKATRAEPVAALDEKGRVHHVGQFDVLEDELVSWDRDPRRSPNRLDARVWLVTALLLTGNKPGLVFR